MAEAKKNQVATKEENTAVAAFDASMFEADAQIGLGNISQEDLALPFLKIVSIALNILVLPSEAKDKSIL